MNEELLISIVQQYPELYDLEDPRYHDKQRRMNIWEEIAGDMNETANACKEKWKKIRENFKKANKLRKIKSGQAAKKMKPIRYAKELRFLLPYIQNDDQSLTTIPTISSDEESFISPPSTPGSPVASSVTSKGSKKIKTGDELTSTHSIFQSYLENKYSQDNATQRSSYQEQDTLVDFFKNLGQTVKQFPLDMQVRVKSEVFNIVNNAEAELVQRNNTIEFQSTYPNIALSQNTNYPVNVIPSAATPNIASTSYTEQLISYDYDDTKVDAQKQME